MDDVVHVAGSTERRGASRSADMRPGPAVRVAAGTVLALLAFGVLLGQAPYAPLGPLTAFALAGRLQYIVAGFGLAAAVAACVAVCSLSLHPPMRRALPYGWLATVAGTAGGIMVCIGASALAGIHVLDETVGINVSHPLRGPFEALIPIPIVAGTALVGTWLLVTGWLGHRRTVLWPTAGTLAILAGGGYVAAAAVVSVAAHFHDVGYLLGVSATGFLAGWSLLVALRR